jgi:hypothetical protein
VSGGAGAGAEGKSKKAKGERSLKRSALRTFFALRAEVEGLKS